MTGLHCPVSEHESALLQALEAALERQLKDGDLAAQIGAALVSTHQYRRALDYYHKAVRNSPANRPLQLHLARLLLRLKSWDSAEKVHVCSCVSGHINAHMVLHEVPVVKRTPT
jgi:cytochrome c-type biogenesis protein CcmH/NrfG